MANEQEPTISEKRHKLIAETLAGYNLPHEKLKAVVDKQDLLFCFGTRLQSYDECKAALKDVGLAACIYVGSMVWSFVDAQVSMGEFQLEVGKHVFQSASIELGNLWLMSRNDAILVEAATMHQLAESVDVIEGVAQKIYERYEF